MISNNDRQLLAALKQIDNVQARAIVIRHLKPAIGKRLKQYFRKIIRQSKGFQLDSRNADAVKQMLRPHRRTIVKLMNEDGGNRTQVGGSLALLLSAVVPLVVDFISKQISG